MKKRVLEGNPPRTLIYIIMYELLLQLLSCKLCLLRTKLLSAQILEFWSCSDECLTSLVGLVLLEVLNEAGSEILSLLIPL